MSTNNESTSTTSSDTDYRTRKVAMFGSPSQGGHGGTYGLTSAILKEWVLTSMDPDQASSLGLAIYEEARRSNPGFNPFATLPAYIPHDDISRIATTLKFAIGRLIYDPQYLKDIKIISLPSIPDTLLPQSANLQGGLHDGHGELSELASHASEHEPLPSNVNKINYIKAKAMSLHPIDKFALNSALSTAAKTALRKRMKVHKVTPHQSGLLSLLNTYHNNALSLTDIDLMHARDSYISKMRLISTRPNLSDKDKAEYANYKLHAAVIMHEMFTRNDNRRNLALKVKFLPRVEKLTGNAQAVMATLELVNTFAQMFQAGQFDGLLAYFGWNRADEEKVKAKAKVLESISNKMLTSKNGRAGKAWWDYILQRLNLFSLAKHQNLAVVAWSKAIEQIMGTPSIAKAKGALAANDEALRPVLVKFQKHLAGLANQDPKAHNYYFIDEIWNLDRLSALKGKADDPANLKWLFDALEKVTNVKWPDSERKEVLRGKISLGSKSKSNTAADDEMQDVLDESNVIKEISSISAAMASEVGANAEKALILSDQALEETKEIPATLYGKNFEPFAVRPLSPMSTDVFMSGVISHAKLIGKHNGSDITTSPGKPKDTPVDNSQSTTTSTTSTDIDISDVSLDDVLSPDNQTVSTDVTTTDVNSTAETTPALQTDQKGNIIFVSPTKYVMQLADNPSTIDWMLDFAETLDKAIRKSSHMLPAFSGSLGSYEDRKSVV